VIPQERRGFSWPFDLSMTRLAHGAEQIGRAQCPAGVAVKQPTALVASIWLVCALLGTCTLGVVALERAAEPRGPALDSEPGVALIAAAQDDLAAWQRSAHEAGLIPEVVSPSQLASLPPERFRVWLVAGPGALDDAGWVALDGFALRGGGIVFAALSQPLEPDAAARDAQALRRLFPGDRFELRQGAAGALSTGGRAPLAAGLAGEPIALARAGARLATRSGGALIWGSDPLAGAALAGLYHGAPAVWIGCPLDWIADPASAARLAANALRHAAREPLVDVTFAGIGAAGSAIRSEQTEPREGELLVVARNEGAGPASDVTLRVYLPVGSLRPKLERRGWFARRPLVRYASGRTWMELIVPELDPGESVEYTLRF
jgi:hypothetical protein